MNAAPAQEPPFNIEVEQALLGVCMIDRKAAAMVADLEAEAFYDPLHQRCWAAIRGLQERNKVATYVTVAAELTPDKGLEEVGGGGYLRSLCRAAPAMANVRDYGQIIADLASRRALIRAGEDLVQAAYVAPADATSTTILAEHRRQIEGIERGLALDERDGYLPFEAAITVELERAEAALNGDRPEAILTGITELDKLTGGLQSDDVAIVAGRPGMGKTIALEKLTLACARQGRPAVFFEFEMSRGQLVHRIMSDWLYQPGQGKPVEFSQFRRGTLTTEQLDTLAKARAELGRLPIHIFDRAGLTVEQMGARADRIFQKAGKMGLLAVDYLQLVTPGGRYAGDRYAEVSEVSGALKRLAKRLKCPVLTASQLSRRVEDRPEKDRMPRMPDLRESGAIEQDADIIAGLLRRAVYIAKREPKKTDARHLDWVAEMAEAETVLDVDVMKNRGGPTGTFQTHIHIGAGGIRDLENKDSGPPPALALEFGIPERRG